MQIRRRGYWQAGLRGRLAEPTDDTRNWLIELQVQIGVQDMETSAARIADEERGARSR